MKKTTIFMLSFILLFILISLIVGAGYRLNLDMVVREYEEECYQYKIIFYNETFERPCGEFEWIFRSINGSLELLPCFNTIETFNITDKCIKHHLVRKVVP